MGDTNNIRGWHLRVAITNSVGFSENTALPLWIGSAAAYYGLSGWQVSLAATGQLVASAIANLLSPLLSGIVGVATMGLAAAGLSALADLLIVLVPSAFLPATILSGACLGVVLGTSNRLIGASEHSQKGFATLQIVETVFAGLFFLTSPWLLRISGLDGLFLSLFALKLLVCILILPISRQTQVEAQVSPDWGEALRVWLRGLLTILAFTIFFIGEGAIYQQLLAFGRVGASLDPVAIGRMLAVGLAGGFAGAFCARILDAKARPGLLACLGCIFIVPGIVMITTARSAPAFAAGIIILETMVMFIVPNVFSLLAELDHSGRWASIGPAALILGGSLGPVMAHMMITTDGDYMLFTGAAAGLILAASAAFLGIEYFARRTVLRAAPH